MDPDANFRERIAILREAAWTDTRRAAGPPTRTVHGSAVDTVYPTADSADSADSAEPQLKG